MVAISHSQLLAANQSPQPCHAKASLSYHGIITRVFRLSITICILVDIDRDKACADQQEGKNKKQKTKENENRGII